MLGAVRRCCRIRLESMKTRAYNRATITLRRDNKRVSRLIIDVRCNTGARAKQARGYPICPGSPAAQVSRGARAEER